MMIEEITRIPIYTIDIISIVAAVVALVALIYSFGVQVYAKKIKERYMSLVKGEVGIDIETLFQNQNADLETIKNKLNQIDTQIKNHEYRLKRKTSEIVMKRYNAFGETGNDLSFSVALINEEGNGAVISSIYGREESRIYAKPIRDNKSSYKLSSEEEEVVKNTMN